MLLGWVWEVVVVVVGALGSESKREMKRLRVPKRLAISDDLGGGYGVV